MRCAVLGDPVDHSLSPVIHRAAYRDLGLEDWRYDAVPVAAGGLAAFVDALDPAEWRGLSLTMPLKREAVPLLSSYDEWVAATGACNTVLLDADGSRHGLNTDVTGALMVLGEHDVPLERAVVLGGGATATSLLLALAERGMRRATLVVRDPERAGETVHAVAAHRSAPEVELRTLDRPGELAGDIVVSTVPASAQVPELLAAVADIPLVFEVVYDPWPTPLAAAAGRSGRTVLSGLDLLVAQAVNQVVAMTGRFDVPAGAMRRAAEEELRGEGFPVSVLVAAGCALAAGVVGWFTPAVVRRLPEPPPEGSAEVSAEEVPAEEVSQGGGDPDESGTEEPSRKPRRPRKPVPDFSLWGMHAVEREKEPYRDLADVRHLALGCALASALVAGALGWKFGWYPILAVVVPPVPVCVAIAVIDWRTRYIPSRLVLPATAYVVLAGVVLWMALDARDELVRGLVGLVVVRSFFWVLWFVRAAGMGFGDVRLGALLGFVLGYLGVGELFFGTWIGFIVFSLPGSLVALAKRDYRLMRVPFPFGPFMLVGALLGVFLGQPIVDALWG